MTTDQQKRDLIEDAKYTNVYTESHDELRSIIDRLSAVVEESLAPQPQAVCDERKRAIEKGYDADHDDAHGREHLIHWAKNYALAGEVAKAAGMLVALSEYDDRNAAPQPTDDERALAAAALRIRDDMLVSHVQGLNRIARSAAADPSRHPSTLEGEVQRIEQSNDIAYTVIKVAQNKAPREFVTLDFRYGIADALWDAGYRKVAASSPPVTKKGESNG